MKFNSMQRSVLAIIFCVLFLWTGKKFIWNNALEDPLTEQTSSADITPADTTSTVSTTETTTTTLTFNTVATLSQPEGSTDSAAGTTTDTSAGTTTTESAALSGSVTYTDSASGSAATTTTTATSTTATTTLTPASSIWTPAVDPAGMVPAPEGYFNDALFIGDSRTVGLANYGPIAGADYFATVGMSTYNIDKAKSEVETTKGQTFEQVMAAKQYGKVYVMLGINEVGNARAVTQQKFTALIDRIKAAQPGAIIYIEANLHVSAARSAKDKVVNNTQINDFNAWLAAQADNVTTWYLDINPVFDDGNGNLPADSTGDGTHPYAKLYLVWADWLRNHVIVK